MRKVIGTVALLLAFTPLAYAQESIGDTAREVKTEAVKAKRTAGKKVRKTGRELKAAGRKARQAVITRCADGRHTAQGASECAAHGGVQDPK